ncbi:MAG: ABC transporter ATP-binding protein [Candidatus Thermoplasmatota archaeon]|nr:ABC transporter ATP-binding protein [Candidatus Thermoplasmatota archaeon]
MTQNLLKIENVKKAYRKYNLFGKEISKFSALNGLNLNVGKGQIYGFLGPNGAGKTTTIKCIIGILEADSGNIIIDGRKIEENRLFFKNKIGFLPEQVGLYGKLTAKESLQFYGGFYNLNYDLIEERGNALLTKLGLEKDSNRRVSEFSLGMKKRLALCVALLNEPEILVMDEPTSGLDPRGVKALRIVLKDLNRKGLTIILSSHVLTEVQEICSHVGIINNGKLIREESISGIRKEIEKKSIRLLLKVKDFPEKTSKDLTKSEKIKSIKQKNNGKHKVITLELKEEYIPWVTDFLVSKRIQIFSIEPQKNSLEEIFLKETGGD